MKTKKEMNFRDIGKQLPYTLPDGYFNDFSEKIETLITIKQPVRHFAFTRWMYVAAAVVVVIFICTPLYFSNQNKQIAIQNSDSYESYVLSQVDENTLVNSYIDQNNEKK